MPSAVAKPTTDRRASSPAVLDPRSLGRPVHRLAEFARRFEDELNLHWAEALNQRYQAALSVATSFGALNLFISFVNLFLFLLRIFGSRE